MNPQSAEIIRRAMLRAIATRCCVIITRDNGEEWRGAFPTPAARDEFIARAMRLGHAPAIAIGE